MLTGFFKVLHFILSGDDFEMESKIYSFTFTSCLSDKYSVSMINDAFTLG